MEEQKIYFSSKERVPTEVKGWSTIQRFFRLNFQPLFGKGACFSPKKAQLSHENSFVILTQSDILPQTFVMHKSLHQINDGCEIEMDATCNRTSKMSKSESLIFTEENARKVCQWLRCVLYSVNRVGKIGRNHVVHECHSKKKKKNQLRENPRHWAQDKKTWSNRYVALLILKEANQSLAMPYKISFLYVNDPKETEHHIGMALLYLEE